MHQKVVCNNKGNFAMTNLISRAYYLRLEPMGLFSGSRAREKGLELLADDAVQHVCSGERGV